MKSIDDMGRQADCGNNEDSWHLLPCHSRQGKRVDSRGGNAERVQKPEIHICRHHARLGVYTSGKSLRIISQIIGGQRV